MSNLESSKYVQYLPRIYQQGSGDTYDSYFLGRFLKAFERVLTGNSDAVPGETIGIEALLERFDQYFDPFQAPAQFVQWLAGWVALELEEGVNSYGAEDNNERSATPVQTLPLNAMRKTVNRSMIGTMVQLYKKRGTWEGLLDYLQLYAGEENTITINEYEEPGRIGSAGHIGVDIMVGNSKPCFFSVHTIIPAHSRSTLVNKVKTIHKVIEKEKPFYANYILSIEVPAMRVGVCSRVGKETLLGGMQEE